MRWNKSYLIELRIFAMTGQKKTVADGKKIFISRDDILNLYQIIFRISLDFQIIIV